MPVGVLMEIVDGRRRFGLSLTEFARSPKMHLQARARMVAVAVPPVPDAVVVAEQAPQPEPVGIEAPGPEHHEAPRVYGPTWPEVPYSPREPEPVDPAAVPLRARVYRNQWIVDCPDCHNAEFAWPDTPWFMCSDCLNGMTAHAWRPVQFPADRVQIEATLRARRLPSTRNWDWSESLADLKRENREHGDAEEAV
jgi:hypothetical protein